MTECYICDSKATWYDCYMDMFLCDDCKEDRIRGQFERLEEKEQ